MGKIFKKAIGIAAPIIGSAIPGVGTALGAAIGGAVGGAVGGGGLKGALLGGVTGYAGNVIGNSLSGPITSSLSKAGASNTLANKLANTSIGRLASNVAGPVSGSALLGGAAANYAGNAIASQIGEAIMPTQEESGTRPETPKPFQPTRNVQLELPGSLGQFKDLDERQQSTNLANQGVYGGGLGSEENTYFTNLINRRLIDTSGNVASDFSGLAPVESSYLTQLGLGGQSNPRSLLEALSKWRPA